MGGGSVHSLSLSVLLRSLKVIDSFDRTRIPAFLAIQKSEAILIFFQRT